MSTQPGSQSRFASFDRTGKAIQRQAAEWLALRQARSLTLAEEANFADWCARDPRHPAVYAEVEAAWAEFDRLAAYPHSIDVSPDPDLLVPRRVRSSGRVVGWSVALAAAAAIAVAGLVWLPSSPTAPDAPRVAQADARFLRLPDGSAIELNADASVTEHFTATERRVRLVWGEAHFSVAKDPEREFIVEVRDVAVRALGTAFNVRLHASTVEVLVTEGSVRVMPAETAAAALSAAPEPQAGRAPAILAAGQRTVVPAVPAADTVAVVIETVPPAEIDRILAWQTSRFSFDATPLAEVVARFNHYSSGHNGRIRLTVEDASLGALRISGRVRSDNVTSFVEALESSFGVRAEPQPGGEIILRRAARP